MTSQRVGEVCFPVSDVMLKLRAEDRDVDGLVWVTPVIGLDVMLDGRQAGRVYLSFETNQPPPSRKAALFARGCVFEASGQREVDQDDLSDIETTCRSTFRVNEGLSSFSLRST